MTSINLGQIAKAQFTKDVHGRGFHNLRVAQLGLLILAAIFGLASLLTGLSTSNISSLLTATSIITGLTFAMAMRFWDRRIDISVAEQNASYLQRKQLIETVSTHLIWTGLIGVISTAVIAFAALVSGQKVCIGLTALTVALFGYQLLLVVESLIKLYNSSIELSI